MNPQQPALVFSHAEVEALHDVGPLGLSVYFWLRGCMDYRTGVVGQSSRISRQMLIDYCERAVPRGAGFQLEKPSLKDLRMAIDALVRHGLLVRKGGDLLVFLMPLAVTASARSKQTGPSAGRGAGRVPGLEPGRVACSSESNDCNGLGGGVEGEPGLEPGLEPGRGVEPNRAYFGVQRKTVHSLPYVNHSTVESVGTADSTLAFADDSQKPGEQGQSQNRSAGGVATPAIAVVKALADHAGMRVSALNPAVQALAELEPSVEQLAEALVRCKAIRADERSNAPINLPFIRSNLIAVQKAGQVRAPADWRTNTASAQRYARALGVPCADGRAGESMPEFVARIAAFARDTQERAQA
jgi:hypothetical protein